jgi:hypothetical protein
MATTQSSQEVINHHAQALSAEGLEEIVADDSDDAVFIGSGSVQRGKDGIRQASTKLLRKVPQATWTSSPYLRGRHPAARVGAPRAAATASSTASTPSCSAMA